MFRKFYKEFLREFQFYSSYSAYLEYILDERIIKNHEYVIPLLQMPWLNPKRYNVLILNDTEDMTSLSCPIFQSAQHNFDMEKPTALLIHQGAYYYEPIHHIHNITSAAPVHLKAKAKAKATATGKTKAKADSKIPTIAPAQETTSLVIDRTHPNAKPDNRASKIIATYLEKCKSDYFDVDGIHVRTLLDSSAHSVKAQILNYKFHVIAYYTRTNVIVPLKKPTPMDPMHPSTFVFIDTCLKNFKTTHTEMFVKSVLNAINKIVPGYYAATSFIQLQGTKIALKMADIDLIIPLAPYKTIKSSNVYEQIIKDGAIFTMYEKDDMRKSMVSMNQYIEILYKTFLNEMINVINRVPALKKTVEMLKHVENPLPRDIKRVILHDAIKPYAAKLVYHGLPKPEVAHVVSGLTPICSNIAVKNSSSDLSKCQNQCKKVSVETPKRDGRNAICKLSIPANNYEYLFERSIEHLLNPITRMVITPVLTDQELINENIVVFSSADVATYGIESIIAKLTLVGSFHLDQEVVDAKLDVKTIPLAMRPRFMEQIQDHEEQSSVNKPSFMDSSPLKAFQLKKVASNNNDWLYELFYTINRRINAKAATLSEEDIKALLFKKIKSNYRADANSVFDELNDNPSFRKLCNANQEEAVLETIKSPLYKISIYELQILCKIVGVNLFITTRQTQRTPDRMRCLGKNTSKDYYVMLHQQQPAKTSKDGADEFYLYVKPEGNYLFTQKDLGPVFGKCVKAKCTSGFSSADLDDVCPPYK